MADNDVVCIVRSTVLKREKKSSRLPQDKMQLQYSNTTTATSTMYNRASRLFAPPMIDGPAVLAVAEAAM